MTTVDDADNSLPTQIQSDLGSWVQVSCRLVRTWTYEFPKTPEERGADLCSSGHLEQHVQLVQAEYQRLQTLITPSFQSSGTLLVFLIRRWSALIEHLSCT